MGVAMLLLIDGTGVALGVELSRDVMKIRQTRVQANLSGVLGIVASN